MIQTYTWKVALPLGAPKMRTADKWLAMANGIMAYTSFLRGANVSVGDTDMTVSLRVYGKDRWSAQAHARQMMEKVMKSSGLWGQDAELISMVIEPDRRALKEGEGRTPRRARPRITWPSRSPSPEVP